MSGLRPAGSIKVLLAVAVTILVSGCGGDDEDGTPVTAVATTTQLRDLVGQVGGDRVDVEGLLEPGADPHGYEPRPSDVAAIADADVVFRSGGEVDEWLGGVLDNAGSDARAISLIEAVDTIGEEGEPDPHWWQNPRNGVLALGEIAAALSRADPEGRSGYERRARAAVRRLRRVDRRIAACVERVPEARRRIVTSHDALGYFAQRYGIEVVGAVIPSRSTQAQPSAGDVERLVQRIREERVRSIFPETAVDADLERAIAREAGASVGEPLYADSLGEPDSPGGTYAGALAADADALVSGMSGGAEGCRAEG